MYNWNETEFCYKFLLFMNYAVDGSICPDGMKVCGHSYCVDNSTACPITDIQLGEKSQ